MIVGFGATGLTGVATALLSNRLSVRREQRARAAQFRHDRDLQAGQDLIAQMDAVDLGLEALGDATANMRQIYLGPADSESLGPARLRADDEYQRSRATIARLKMRPRAHQMLIGQAEAASKSFLDAINVVRGFLIAQRSDALRLHFEQTNPAAASKVIAFIDAGYASHKAFERQAQIAYESLLASGALTASEPERSSLAARLGLGETPPPWVLPPDPVPASPPRRVRGEGPAKEASK